MPHRRGEQENVGCSQSIIQKRKVHCAMGAALNMPAWHHLLMGHRLTCYLSWLPPPSPSSSLSLSLLCCTRSYQCSLVGRVNNYSMTTLLCKLEGCLHKEKRICFKRAMGYFKKMGELVYLQRPAKKCLCICISPRGDNTSWK